MKSIQLPLQDIYTFILGSPFVSCIKSTNDTESNLKLQAKHTIRKVSRSPPKSRKLETNHRSHRLGLRNLCAGAALRYHRCCVDSGRGHGLPPVITY